MLDFLRNEKENDDKVEQDIDYAKEVLKELEYMNSYLAQLNITQSELLKQQTIANALCILDSEYNNADCLMNIEEIIQKKEALFGEIFVDYQVKQKDEEKNG